jgi:hypothetical protein
MIFNLEAIRKRYARVLGNPMGEIRGKIHGHVFSRNRSGQIIRGYVKPVNVNSEAQVASRAAFKSASQSWKGLLSAEQQTWNVFALATYNPLKVTNVGQYTGNQSFVAVQNAVSNAIAGAFTNDWTAYPTGTAPVGTVGGFTPVRVAPSNTVVANIKQTALPPATMQVVNMALSLAGEIKVDILFIGIPPTGLVGTDFIDSNNNKYTFVVYASDKISTSGNKPRNYYFFRLGNCDIQTFSGHTLSGLHGISFTLSCAAQIPKYKQWFNTGDITVLSLLAVAENGTQVKMTQKNVIIT